MDIYDLKTMQKCSINVETVVALGTFDGCHLGHLEVIREAYSLAKKNGLKSIVYTFNQIPRSHTQASLRQIFTIEEKIKAISALGIDYIAITDFEKVKGLNGKEFFEKILKGELKAKMATCGFNYRFGESASCDAHDLAQLFENSGGSVRVCDKILIDKAPLSSTILRKMLENGEVERTLSYMKPYSVLARVEDGKKLGRAIGFPTINQLLPPEKLIPKRGVYITECEIGEDVFPSITNVGTRPTTDGENSFVNMETHIIGYNGYLYGSYIRVNFYKLLRDEIRFDSIEALKAQIEKDIEKARAYFLY